MNFSQFLDAAHISTLNCDEMAGDRPRQPAYEIFSIKRRFQQSRFSSLQFSAKTVADKHTLCLKKTGPQRPFAITPTVMVQ